MNNGDLGFHFINSVLVTVAIALFVLWRYRLAVLHGMQQGETASLNWTAAITLARPTTPPGDLLTHERAMRRRISAAWLLTTAICALPMAIAYMYASKLGQSPTYALGLIFCYMLATLPMIAVSLAWPPRRSILALGAMLLGFAALFLLSAVIERAIAGRPFSLHTLGIVPLFFDMVWNQLWMAGIFWLLSWPVRLRGVVPLTFAAILLFGLAPLVGSRLTALLAASELGSPWAIRLGMNGVFLLIALPMGWLAWLRLRRLAADYAAKRFSDAQLLARMWWLMLVATISLDIMLGRAMPLFALLLALAAIGAFAPVNQWTMARFGVRARAAARPVQTLLLLRVFGYTARTERLFDRVAARWRLIGPVTMIAAPDVTARTIDAGDYLRWLTGRLDESFVTSRDNLDARLAALDLQPDPDGRFRINEFCCRASTWQATVVELMARADAVIMDVRGMTTAQRGCEFELQQLAQRMAAQRIVLVVDQTTDQAILRSALGRSIAQVELIDVRSGADIDRAFLALAKTDKQS